MRLTLRPQIPFLLPALCFALALAGCAKVGDPQPPGVLVPAAAGDLRAIQYADTILLTVSMPQKNTTGSPVTTLDTIELFRVREGRPGTARTWSDDEFEQRAERILAVHPAGFAAYTSGTAFVYRDQKPVVEAGRLYDSGLTYAVRFINRKNQTAGFGNRAYIEPLAIPGPPSGLSFLVSADRVRLTWLPPQENLDGSKPPNVVGYNVYRSADANSFPPAPMNARPLAESAFEDAAFEFGSTYYYAVSVVGNLKEPFAESLPSAPLRVEAIDRFPPGPPENLNAVVDGKVVVLLWAAPPESDVAGYRVYRREEGAATRSLLSASTIQALSFRDETASGGKRVTYTVTSIDRSGNEGAPAEVAVEVR